jgi:hypothetical protein
MGSPQTSLGSIATLFIEDLKKLAESGTTKCGIFGWRTFTTGLSRESKLTRLRYEKKFPGSDLRKMEDMKHVTEAVARSTGGKLGKRATVKTVRGKMRKLMSIWLRKTNLPIPQDVHDSVAPVSAPADQNTPRY